MTCDIIPFNNLVKLLIMKGCKQWKLSYCWYDFRLQLDPNLNHYLSRPIFNWQSSWCLDNYPYSNEESQYLGKYESNHREIKYKIQDKIWYDTIWLDQYKINMSCFIVCLTHIMLFITVINTGVIMTRTLIVTHRWVFPLSSNALTI